MNRVFLTITCLFFFIQFYGQGIVSVTKVGETTLQSHDNIFIYALPRTNLSLKVITRRTITLAGPFSIYADEFLGIKNVPTKNKVEWKIDSIEVEPYMDANLEELYAVETTKGFNPSIFAQLTDAGFILNPGFLPKTAMINTGIIPNVKDQGYIFSNISAQKFIHILDHKITGTEIHFRKSLCNADSARVLE